MEYRISVEPTSEVMRKLRVEVPHAVFHDRFDKALKRAAKSVQLKGFRPGKAPLNIVEQYYGGKISSDLINELCQGGIDTAIEQHNLKVVGIDEVKLVDPHEEHTEPHEDHNHDLVFTASLSLLPQPELKSYKGLTYSVVLEELSDKHIQKALEDLQDRFAEFKQSESGAITPESYVSVRVKARVGDEYFLGEASGEGIYDSGELNKVDWPEGLRKGLVGLTKGDKREITALLPNDFSREQFAGKEAVYSVEVLAFGALERPAIDDELAKKMGPVETLAEFKEKLKEQISKRIEQSNRDRRLAGITKAITEASPFEVPQVMLDEDIRRRLFDMGVLNPKDENSYRVGVQNLRGSFGEAAEARVRSGIILARIIEQENMLATDEEIEAWLENRAQTSEMSREQINNLYRYPQERDRVRQVVTNDKVVEFLITNSKAKEEIKREPIEA